MNATNGARGSGESHSTDRSNQRGRANVNIESGDRRESARQGSDHVENENLIRTAFEAYANGNVAAVASSSTASGARQSGA